MRTRLATTDNGRDTMRLFSKLALCLFGEAAQHDCCAAELNWSGFAKRLFAH